MKKYIVSIFLSVALVFTAFAQKTVKDDNAETRSVGNFHGIEVSTGIHLFLTSGNEEVAVSASQSEYRDKIVTKVVDGILKIYYENKLGSINTKKEKKELKAYVSYKTLDQLDANTGAEVEINGVLTADVLKMKVNTGAIINAVVNVKELEVKQNTGSILTISGTAYTLNVDGDTGSMFKGTDLKTNTCNAKASTGAGVYITVEKEMSVKANTGGYIKYTGNAGIREITTNTGGIVSKI